MIKALSSIPVILMIFLQTSAQNFSVQFGEENKIKRSESAPKLIGGDKSGLYFANFKVKQKYLTSDRFDRIFSLIKYDLSFKEVFDYEYDNNLKGTEVQELQLIKGSLYLFSYLHDIRNKRFKYYIAKINKDNGKIVGELKEAGDFELEKKDAYPVLTVMPSYDSLSIVMTVKAFSGKKGNTDLKIFDLNLNETFSISFDPSTGGDRIIHQAFPIDKNRVVVTESFENLSLPGQQITFANFSLSSYESNGKKIFSTNLESGETGILGCKGFVDNNQLVLAGLISAGRFSRLIRGVFVNKYNMQTGEAISVSRQDISENIIKSNDDKTSVKPDEKGTTQVSGLSGQFLIKNILMNPKTNSPVIIAEIFSYSQYINQYFENNRLKTDTYMTFTTGDILLIQTNEKCEIKTVTTIPKKQIEKLKISGNSSVVQTGSQGASTILSGRTLDFYSSFSSFIIKDKLIIALNDNPGNQAVKKQGDNFKPITDISTSSLFMIAYDLVNGTTTRKSIFSNSGQTIPLIKEAMLIDNQIYVYGTLPHILGKSDFRIVRVTVK